MSKDIFDELYFKWLTHFVNDKHCPVSYEKLLKHLYFSEFYPKLAEDKRRCKDGIELRYRFLYETRENIPIQDINGGPCNILEMMVALCLKCEETMSDSREGERVGQWFWDMILSLGLNHMDDMNYSKKEVDSILIIFLERKYKWDGSGGLFTIKGSPYNLAEVDLWCQLCWFMNTL